MKSSSAAMPGVVFRLGHLGDVALTTGVLAHWHAVRGDTFVFVTRTANAPLFDNHPAVVRVVGLEDRHLRDAWPATARELAREFARHELIDLHGTLRSRVLGWLWRGPVRRYPKQGITRRLFGLSRLDRLRIKLEATTVPQRYALARDSDAPEAAVITPRLFLTEAELAGADERLTGMNRHKPRIALHPYATHPAKQWPRGHWQELTRLLTAAGMGWFVVGRDAAPLVRDNRRDYTNATSLRETCALMARADLLITADSGPMHLAGGVGTPAAALFGPTVRAWGFFPAGAHDRIIEADLDCRPCSLHGGKPCAKAQACLTTIRPEAVMAVVRQMLAGKKA
ncbi:glycosyltransferase family 9 protein [Pseudodesulfovibrio sp. F-1]|uniref:Glycosyltransferase family 9 protein n=1 Tax=Pseudodesulfovibrio alkaliphilus TaxID=2661613 RepID=A0A7K1KJR6_9BACT|nr:glycosyltransferase family 9 protein [Pseudodesulfovibrio alkaliphilus]MUM76299.1 glycosyltransferase family 9 protein [Pseudodesulfovibrio alkaliphilus]